MLNSDGTSTPTSQRPRLRELYRGGRRNVRAKETCWERCPLSGVTLARWCSWVTASVVTCTSSSRLKFQHWRMHEAPPLMETLLSVTGCWGWESHSPLGMWLLVSCLYPSGGHIPSDNTNWTQGFINKLKCKWEENMNLEESWGSSHCGELEWGSGREMWTIYIA